MKDKDRKTTDGQKNRQIVTDSVGPPCWCEFARPTVFSACCIGCYFASQLVSWRPSRLACQACPESLPEYGCPAHLDTLASLPGSFSSVSLQLRPRFSHLPRHLPSFVCRGQSSALPSQRMDRNLSRCGKSCPANDLRSLFRSTHRRYTGTVISHTSITLFSYVNEIEMPSQKM